MSKIRFRAISLAAAAVLAASTSGAALASFEGFGQDIPLESAARQIVPDGWSVEFADGVDRSAAVSWSSAPDWQSALRTAASRKGYQVTFSGSTATVSEAPASEAPARAPAPAASSTPAPAPAPAAQRPYSSSPAPGQAQASRPAPRAAAPAPRAAAAPAAQGGGGFSIRPWQGAPSASLSGKGEGFEPYAGGRPGFAVTQGQMLRSVLADWSASAGWQVVWDSEYDYRIEAPASFQGDFVDAASALLEAMRDARPAITADFFRGNRVVVVSNNSSDEVN